MGLLYPLLLFCSIREVHTCQAGDLSHPACCGLKVTMPLLAWTPTNLGPYPPTWFRLESLPGYALCSDCAARPRTYYLCWPSDLPNFYVGVQPHKVITPPITVLNRELSNQPQAISSSSKPVLYCTYVLYTFIFIWMQGCSNITDHKGHSGR
jgi:hypothetical protein